MNHMLTTRKHADDGVSDIVGTILLLGVIVALVGATAVHYKSTIVVEDTPVRLDMSAVGAGSQVEILHLGGDPVDAGVLRAIVTVGQDVRYDGPAGPAGTQWEIGTSLTLALSQPLPAAPADIMLVHGSRGEVIAASKVGAQVLDLGPSGAFSITVWLDGSSSPPVVAPPSQVLAEIDAAHAFGRKYVRHVFADMSPLQGPVWFGLRDDGTRGDVMPGDGTWSGVLNVPLGVTPGTYSVTFTGVDLAGYSTSRAATIQVI